MVNVLSFVNASARVRMRGRSVFSGRYPKGAEFAMLGHEVLNSTAIRALPRDAWLSRSFFLRAWIASSIFLNSEGSEAAMLMMIGLDDLSALSSFSTHSKYRAKGWGE